MSDFIVDATVVAKWLVEEPDSSRARSLIDEKHFLRAPDLVIPEVANVLWKRSMRGDITSEELTSMGQLLLEHIDVSLRLLPSRILVRTAVQIASTEKHSVYDCLYLASAVQARCRLVTADARFIRSIESKALRTHVVSLNEM